MPGPLAGFRIVDLSAVVSGLLATMWLANVNRGKRSLVLDLDQLRASASVPG
jgi:crotonobetainyl-CoA:carnitine CoA-transferase CaiB-like acyl-CoA transferase